MGCHDAIDRVVMCLLLRGFRRNQGLRLRFVPHGAVYLTTVGYGMGAAYGHCITRVRDVYWLRELGIAQALWVLEVDKIGPFLVEGDAEGRSLFALANREIDARIDEIYRDLPPPALSRFGEVLSRKGEVI